LADAHNRGFATRKIKSEGGRSTQERERGIRPCRIENNKITDTERSVVFVITRRRQLGCKRFLLEKGLFVLEIVEYTVTKRNKKKTDEAEIESKQRNVDM
jgi:hypothetical protein